MVKKLKMKMNYDHNIYPRSLFLTSPLGANFDPQRRSYPPGVNFVPEGREVIPWK
jgi:hypothetical protein